MLSDSGSPGPATIDDVVVQEFSLDESPTNVVLEAVSNATGRPLVPTGSGEPLPPLYDAIDPEVLDAVFESGRSDHRGTTLKFRYGDCQVTVDGVGTVTIEPV